MKLERRYIGGLVAAMLLAVATLVAPVSADATEDPYCFVNVSAGSTHPDQLYASVACGGGYGGTYTVKVWATGPNSWTHTYFDGPGTSEDSYVMNGWYPVATGGTYYLWVTDRSVPNDPAAPIHDGSHTFTLNVANATPTPAPVITPAPTAVPVITPAPTKAPTATATPTKAPTATVAPRSSAPTATAAPGASAPAASAAAVDPSLEPSLDPASSLEPDASPTATAALVEVVATFTSNAGPTAGPAVVETTPTGVQNMGVVPMFLLVLVSFVSGLFVAGNRPKRDREV